LYIGILWYYQNNPLLSFTDISWKQYFVTKVDSEAFEGDEYTHSFLLWCGSRVTAAENTKSTVMVKLRI
jgi:hypothetical protein